MCMLCVRATCVDIATILRETSPRNMNLSRDVIDVIGDEMKPASRDR